MPLDPIHTLRAAKRLHLKDGVFVSLAPVGVAEGHLRAVNGKIAWLGSASAVERGEDVLECWRQVVIPALPMADVDPVDMALRAVPESEAPRARQALVGLDEEGHRFLALQAFSECAALGVMLLTVDASGASAERIRGTAAAAEEAGIRCVLEGTPDDAGGALASELVRRAARPSSPAVTLETLARGLPADRVARLSAAGGPPDVLALVRLLERRERGLGFRCLANTYAAFTAAFGAPCGAFVKGAFFDVVFLDYEPPARLEPANLEAFLTAGVGPWCVEASAVSGRPVLRRHEILTVDRAAVAQRVAELVAAARR